jgi:16S rRNA (cytidine(1402)-2'-O)-methyltransferase
MEMIGKVRRMKLREQLSNSEIAKRTGLSRNTVKKWLKAPGDQAPKYKRQSGFTKLSAFEGEDTRHTQQLLRAYGLDRPGSQLLALHQHNEAEAAQNVMHRLAQGERVAYVSDAGTPAISDPGARLVAAVRQAGYRVLPLPGASSVTTAVSASGMKGDNGFVFLGFLASKSAERQQAVQALAQESRAVVLLEAPPDRSLVVLTP